MIAVGVTPDDTDGRAGAWMMKGGVPMDMPTKPHVTGGVVTYVCAGATPNTRPPQRQQCAHIPLARIHVYIFICACIIYLATPKQAVSAGLLADT